MNLITVHPIFLRALSHLTMLGPPKNPTYAMSQEDWTTFSATEEAVELPEAHPDYPCVEIWKYTPREHQVPGLVDPLSLILSFGNSDDERIAQALTDLATQSPWPHP